MSKTVFDYEELARRKRVTFIGEYPRTTRHKTAWECTVCRLVWETTYHILDWSKVGCPACAKKSVTENQRLKREDYIKLSNSRKDVSWIEEQNVPRCTKNISLWKCTKCGRTWKTQYDKIKHGAKCQKCGRFVNGQRASQLQISLGEQLCGQINYKLNGRWLDIAFPEERKAIELDVWYWHAHKIDLDRLRAQELINAGWSILTIKTQKMLPGLEEIRGALLTLSGYQEIVTSEWGHGKTFNSTRIL